MCSRWIGEANSYARVKDSEMREVGKDYTHSVYGIR